MAPPPLDEDFIAEVGAYASSQEERIVRTVREVAEQSETPDEEKARVAELLDKAGRQELSTLTLLALLDHELRDQVTRALEAPVPKLVVADLAKEVVTFEDLAKLTDREIQVLLREVDQRDLVVALKGASEAVRDRLLGNMSERVRNFIQEEVFCLGPMAAVECFKVQVRIVAQLMELAERGQVTLQD